MSLIYYGTNIATARLDDAMIRKGGFMPNNFPQDHRPKNIIRLPQVCKKTGLSKSSIHRLIARGQFPKQLKLSTRSSGWVEIEIDDWLDTKAKNRTN